MRHGKGDSGGPGFEGSVGHALAPELLVAETEELAIEGDAGRLECGCTNWGTTLPQGVHLLEQLRCPKPHIPQHAPAQHTHEAPPSQSLVRDAPSGRPGHARVPSAHCRGDVIVDGKSAARVDPGAAALRRATRRS